MNDSIEQRARELLAAEWRADGRDDVATLLQAPNLATMKNPAIRAIVAALSQAQPAAAQPADTDRLVRELDVALNGTEGAAPQASLCDVVAQVQRIARERGAPVLARSAAQQPAGGEAVVDEAMIERAARGYYAGDTFAVGAKPWAEHGHRVRIGRALGAALSAPTVAVDRERVLASARFRAACYALVALVEGPGCLRWQDSGGFRLKDTAEWVKFYIAAKAMQDRGEPDALLPAPQPAAGPVPEASEQGTYFIDGIGWVVPCRDAVRFVKQLAAAQQEVGRG